MRLVNREFERKISCLAFKHVVVPFKAMLYDAPETESTSDSKGNYDPQTHHVNDGMNVFRMWGPAIKKFALTFEVAQGESHVIRT